MPKAHPSRALLLAHWFDAMATAGERRSTHVPHVPLPIFHALAIALILASVSTRSQTGSVVSMGWGAGDKRSRGSPSLTVAPDQFSSSNAVENVRPKLDGRT